MDEIPETPSRRFTDLAPARAPERPTPRPIDVAALRRRLHMTQREFAACFGFSVATLRHWERGNRRPMGPALVLLHVIADHPRAVRVAVRKARRASPGILAPIEQKRSWRAPPGLAYRL
jgi:putative transcriptional regulator